MKDAPPDLWEVGCRPSWNAYTEKEAGVEMDLHNYPYRHAGGHMHFSDFVHVKSEESIKKFIKLLDWKLGLPEAYLFGRDQAWMRRRFYGRAGDFRFRKEKSYCGESLIVEYRTPGPEMWNHQLFVSMFASIARGVDFRLPALWKEYEQLGIERKVQDAINKGEGITDLLGDMSGSGGEGIYTPLVLRKIREKLKSSRFIKAVFTEAHTGYNDFMEQLGIHKDIPAFRIRA
jgi:hypothetical protein